MSLEEQTEKEAAAFRRLMSDPSVSLEAKKLYKKAVPDARFPELEAEDRLAAATKPLQDKIEAMEKEQIETRVTRNREENHRKCRDAGLEPDAVEKVITDEKIGSYDTAIKYIQAQNKNVAPTPANYRPPIDIKGEDAAEWRKNPTRMANTIAHQVIDELRAKRV